VNTSTLARTSVLGLAFAGLLLSTAGCGALQQRAECSDLAGNVNNGVSELSKSVSGNAKTASAAAQRFVDDLEAQAAKLEDQELKRSVEKFAATYQTVVDFLVETQKDPVAAAKASQQMTAKMSELSAAGEAITKACA
jgi:predicted component of type VI protein secretion system